MSDKFKPGDKVKYKGEEEIGTMLREDNVVGNGWWVAYFPDYVEFEGEKHEEWVHEVEIELADNYIKKIKLEGIYDKEKV